MTLGDIAGDRDTRRNARPKNSVRGSHYSIVVVGAGPVGLSLAVELGTRGISCLLVERNDRVGMAPRAKTTNVRTRTHMRRWGIAQNLSTLSPLGIDYPTDVHFVTRLGGKALARIPNAFACFPERNSDYPEHGQWIPQYKLEQVLREHVGRLESVDVLFGATLWSAHQEDGRVDVGIHGPDGERKLTCNYLVGADGAHSKVRSLIGAEMIGTVGLSHNYNIVFRAPGLATAHPHGPGVMYWQINADGASLIGPMDQGDIWFFMPTKLAPGTALSKEQARSLISAATGIDLQYEILSSDAWVASQLIANKYWNGRIFLAGDACHLHPPFGGYGMNMGIGDAVDLGWKLAAVLQGWGGETLLSSYEAERRPVHTAVIKEAVANHRLLSNDLWTEGLEDDSENGCHLRNDTQRRILEDKVREFHTLGTVLGIGYRHSPVILEDGSIPPPFDSQRYVPSACPGFLAPHAWLEDGSSLYDHFGAGFTLIVGENAPKSLVGEIRSDAKRFAVPLTVLESGEVASLPLYADNLTLIRPDQHIAWHGTKWDRRNLPCLLGFATEHAVAHTVR